MKKKKLSFINASAMLSKNEMKTITAGSGDCQIEFEVCSAYQHLNCCSNLYCDSATLQCERDKP